MTENPSNDRRRPSVLVADDDPMVRLLARESLKHADFDVSEAANGQEALTCFDRTKPDIIMLDVQMPEMDGFSACSRIRNHPAGELTPILMVTGLDDVESINRAYETGATDFVTKPINWTILGHRLRYMLRASRSIEAFHRSEMKNRALLDAVPDLMLRLNRQGYLLGIQGTKGLRAVTPGGRIYREETVPGAADGSGAPDRQESGRYPHLWVKPRRWSTFR